MSKCIMIRYIFKPNEICPDQTKKFFGTLVVIFDQHHLLRKNVSQVQKIRPDQTKKFFRTLAAIFDEHHLLRKNVSQLQKIRPDQTKKFFRTLVGKKRKNTP